VRKRSIIVTALAILAALGSAEAQAADFLDLVRHGTPQSVRAAICQRADL
jgi:hypothetical protein